MMTFIFSEDDMDAGYCKKDTCDDSPSALSRYADYLKAVYANRPVANSDKLPLTPSTVYVKLALVKKERVSRAEVDTLTYLSFQGDIDTILQAKEQIEMDDILKAEDKTRLVVVEGAPGIGKSTFAWELCRQWPTLESLKRFSLVVLLRLREEGVQTAIHITDLLYHRDSELRRRVGEEVERREGEGVLFIFDGFDEFPTEHRKKSLIADIISGSAYLPKATVLVTSRPSGTAQLHLLFQTSIGKHIEIVGFSEKEIHEYAESVFKSGPETLASFKTYLSVNPVVKAMMQNPLNSANVVTVYRETSESGKPIPHTQTQLYTELTLLLLSRHLSAVGDPLASELPDRLEDIPHESDLYQQLVQLGKLAFEGRVRNEVIFKELPEGCSDLGLLVEHRALYARKETKNYNFLHLTHQEYLGAFYVSQLPANEQRTLFIEHKKSEQLRVVWMFVAGLTRMQNVGWDVFKREAQDDSTSGYLVMDGVVFVGSFIIQCLYEAQDVETCTNVFGQSRVKFERSFIITPYDVYAVGYCVSVCSYTWDLSLSLHASFDSNVLEMLEYGLQSVEYGGGSIAKLDLSFCTGILEGRHLVQLPYQIHEHIKTLKMSSSSLDKEELEILADYIPHLHSLTSLDISHNPGGVGSTVKLLRALRQHETLKTLDMNGIEIGMEDVAALSDLIQSPGSLRELTVGEFQPLDVFQQLVRKVLSTSSLETLHITHLRPIPLQLDHKEIHSANSRRHLSFSSDGTKLSDILRENTSLKVLKLLIPLDRDEVRDIVHSLEDNHSLVMLWLFKEHSQYFSESERQALDPRIHFSEDRHIHFSERANFNNVLWTLWSIFSLLVCKCA